MLALLPTTGRPSVHLDLVRATLSAMAPNGVWGLLTDIPAHGPFYQGHTKFLTGIGPL
ncbi:hypothetical protein [Sphingobium sp. CCH11-B1]|uniref:hypothetical protein n=1 Tax=Sphingobium sp. CCH11-B1 TaxID=1768781 RepID=UPI000A673E2F|nr:hypothetical protein [Sphingobium sp. CCH11-B1]MEA3389125.1 hypothetical protein [Pseudomonadota bacterium]